MSVEGKRWLVAALGLLFLASLIVVAYRQVRTEPLPGARPAGVVSADSRECVKCHQKVSPGIVEQWEQSKHAQRGIGCAVCHGADPQDVDGFEHHGVRIATIVSPLDCSRCHDREFKQQQQSRHAEAAAVAGSLDDFLGVTLEGGAAVMLGCGGCHGSIVKTLPGGKLDPKTWPNGGMGRVNPDGSKGTCAACHSRHDFSLVVARSPDACGKCHRGPKTPELEIYEESKHGIRFRELHDQMSLASSSWVVGRDYHAAPTCATCHMSATPTQPVTHDVGVRLSWTLRPVVSVRQKDWKPKREKMVDVCLQCHGESWVSSYFVQFDGFVDLYNTKFAVPAKHIMDNLRAAKVLTPTPFDEPIEFTYYELWHHEGRRARLGAAMMGPDFVQWQGAYELAKHFYSGLVPSAEKLLPGVTKRALGTPAHRWIQGVPSAVVERQVEFYRQRYSDSP